jgi:hypothetical protein
MSDAAASKYFLKIAEDLHIKSLDVELISAGILAMEIDKFVEKNEISLISTSDGRSGLCRWPIAGLPGRHLVFLYEHVFGLVQPALPKQPRLATEEVKMPRAAKG